MRLHIDDLIREAMRDEEGAFYKLAALRQQEANAVCEDLVLTPFLSDWSTFTRQLIGFLNAVSEHKERFPVRLVGVNKETGDMQYEYRTINQWHLLRFVDFVAEMILPQCFHMTEILSDTCEYVEERIHIAEDGIQPTHLKEGYLLFDVDGIPQKRAMRYMLSIYTREEDRYRSLRIVDTYEVSSTDPQDIKRALVRANPELPHPAIFSFTCEERLPFTRTIYPIALRMAQKHLAHA